MVNVRPVTVPTAETRWPLPRLRRLLLGLYVAAALADAGGKAIAASPAANDAIARFLHGGAADRLRDAKRPSGNFEIFRGASRHLFAGADMYAEYPAEQQDRFKYSPAFALLFAPLAYLPWPLALFLWSTLNAVVLFTAIERVLPQREALVALSFLLLEVIRAMQNAQSNALVAGLVVLAWVALERANAWRAAAAVALGACVKIFPLAALTFAIPRRLAIRCGLWAAAFGALLLALPLAITRPASLAAQYRSWRAVESVDAGQRWFSVMELLHRWTGAGWPNWPVQAAGTLALLAPLALHRERWDDRRFRFLYLCSMLMYLVLFNHQAERASYVIAFAGIALWFAAEPRAAWRTALFGAAFVTMPVLSTLVPVPALRSPTMMLYRLALPTLLVWLAVQRELWARARVAA